MNAKLYLKDGPLSIPITNDMPPMQIEANYGLLLGQEKEVKYYQWFPSESLRCVVNVVDSKNVVRFSVRFMQDFFIVNKKKSAYVQIWQCRRTP